MDIKQLAVAVGEIPELKGTFIEELLDVMQAGNFNDIKDLDPDETKEKVVGDMNDLEKALHTLWDKYSDAEDAIIARFRGETENPVAPEEKPLLQAELKKVRERFKLARDMFWFNIRERFVAHDIDDEVSGFGVRSGFKVVALLGDEHAGFAGGEPNPLALVFGFGMRPPPL